MILTARKNKKGYSGEHCFDGDWVACKNDLGDWEVTVDVPGHRYVYVSEGTLTDAIEEATLEVLKQIPFAMVQLGLRTWDYTEILITASADGVRRFENSREEPLLAGFFEEEVEP